MREIVVKSATAGQRGDDIAPITRFRLTAEKRDLPTPFAATRAEVVEKSRYAYSRKGRLADGLIAAIASVTTQ